MQTQVRELTPNEQALWDQLVAVSPQRSIFAQRWWIDCVTRGEGRLLGCFNGARLLGGLPIWPCTTLGVRRLRQPPLTPYWGPLLDPLTQEQTYRTRLNIEQQVLGAFAQALRVWPDVCMQFHPSLSNWLPFFWGGYAQQTRYTYRIAHGASALVLMECCDAEVRRCVRRAQEKGLILRDMVSPLLVADLYALTLERQGLKRSGEVLHAWLRIAEEAQRRGCLFTTAAVDAAGRVHSADAMVWDDRHAYALIGGIDARVRQCGGGTLTMWHELVRSTTIAIGFDFEGSTIEPVERFFRSFGAEQQPYLLVTRNQFGPLRLARALQAQLQGASATLATRWLPRTQSAPTINLTAYAPAPSQPRETTPAQ